MLLLGDYPSTAVGVGPPVSMVASLLNRLVSANGSAQKQEGELQ